MPAKRLFYACFVVVLMLFSCETIQAQGARDFALANQLMQFGNYKEAAEILQRLVREDPRSYPYFSRLVRCLTELKDYPEAIKATKKQLSTRKNDVMLTISLGDLYFLSNDTTAALKTWRTVLDINKNQPQTWRDVAEAMANRKFYAEAEKNYLEARTFFKNPSLFMNELSNLYLQWGKYNKAAKEWIALVEQDPAKSSLLQRRMFRFEDDDYLDAFIVELEEVSRVQGTNSPNYYVFRDLLIWLYTEKKMYRKALAAARQLEATELPNGQTPVLSLGSRMMMARQYALAEEAFAFYETSASPQIFRLSLEERARLYKQWGDDIRRSDTGTLVEANEKFKKSLSMLEVWTTKFGSEPLPPDLAILFINLTLDQFKDVAKATQLLEVVKKQPDMRSREADLVFLEGRMHQFEGDFMRARISFNRALKMDPLSDLGEKSRYFLGLTDFYGGDFEFCTIQLRALERLSNSLYANDAIRLRTWIQEGEKSDSLKSDLKLLAKSMFLLETGGLTQAMDSLNRLISTHKGTPVAGFALQTTADFLSTVHVRLAGAFLQTHLADFDGAANLERLLWMNARFSDLALKQTASAEVQPQFGITPRALSSNQEVAAMYEKLLVRFPAGFFSQQVRERLQQLEKEVSS